MKLATPQTALTSYFTLDAYQVMSFPVMNQLLCRGASFNDQRVTPPSFVALSHKTPLLVAAFIQLSYCFCKTPLSLHHFFYIVAKKLGNIS